MSGPGGECPHCRKPAAPEAAECPSCGLVFAKWEAAQARRQAPPPQAPAGGTGPAASGARGSGLSLDLKDPLALAAAAAALAARVKGWNFREWLPLPEWWGSVQRLWFPIAALDLAFHEAGHAVFAVLGIDLLTIAGGTLLQLAMPAAVLVHFLRRGEKAGIGAALFWIGINCVEIAWYAADAKMQVIILITGTSGSEGGGVHHYEVQL